MSVLEKINKKVKEATEDGSNRKRAFYVSSKLNYIIFQNRQSNKRYGRKRKNK